MKKLILIFGVIIITSAVLKAQTGDEYFDKKEYASAIAKYQQEVKSSPDKFFNMAKSYFALMEFDKAIAALESYKSEYNKADKGLADQWIELLSRDDDYIEVNNMGSSVNTSVGDYFPYVSKDGKTLYFTSYDREGGYGGEDIWYCPKQADGSWGTVTNIGTDLNTNSHECIMSMSGDGNVAILFGNYTGTFGGGDLFYSVKTDIGWTQPCNLGGTINTSGWESQASLASDGKTLLFISNASGGQGGGGDIYVTQLTDDGWTKPLNLGSTINTNKFEGWPLLAADGKTLYFFSDGHFGFGGKDIFMSKRIGDSWTEWTEPVNLGKYVNTLDNDLYLSIPSSGVKAYLVRSDRPDGLGGNDIYEFIMPPSMRPEMVINVKGFVTDENKQPVSSLIHFYDAGTGTEEATAISSYSDGFYQVSLAPLKKYNIVIDMKNYLYYTDELDLTDLSKLIDKEYMNDVLGTQLNDITTGQKEMATLNETLKKLIDANIDNIDDGFREYTALLKQYKSNYNKLDIAVKKAKLRWISREDKIKDVQKDFNLQAIKIGAKFELKNIFFDFGKTSLRDDSKVELDKLVDIMKRSEIVIELGGHTDSIGSDNANLKLSQDRVNSVKQYLVGQSIDGARIKAVGYGETQPIASNTTEDGRQKNRRVELKILQLQLQREGTDVVVDQPKEEETTSFDFLGTLLAAAKKGGLPPESPCSDKVVYLKNSNNIEPSPVKHKKNNGLNLDLGLDIVEDVDDFVFKHFNPYLLTSNFAMQSIEVNNQFYDYFKGSGLGAGINLVKDNLQEFSMEYYFFNDDSLNWMAASNLSWNWQFAKFLDLPLMAIVGINTHFWHYTNPLNGDKGAIMFNIPVGARFNLQLADDLIVAPVFRYNMGHNIKNIGVSGTWWSLGADVRWKFIQGGVHLNKGDLINFLGFRAGFAF